MQARRRSPRPARTLQRMSIPATTADLVERLDRLLPQTQCGQCGYDGCRPYAEAMARGDAGPEHCPPGGDAGIREANELGSVVLGEALVASSAALVARRVEERLRG